MAARGPRPRVDKLALRHALMQSHGFVARSAAMLEMSKMHAHRLIKRYGLVDFVEHLREKRREVTQ